MNKIIYSLTILYFIFFNNIIYAKDNILKQSNSYLTDTMHLLIVNNAINIMSLRNIINNISHENLTYLSIICREFAISRSSNTCPIFLEFIIKSHDANNAIEHSLPLLKTNDETLDNDI
jgi:hypothetical protein